MKKNRIVCPIPEQEHTIILPQGKKVYFLSDIHLGAPTLNNHRERELKIVHWLGEIRPDCGVLFLLGDIFDFWFEYKHAIPKGFVRFLAKICEFTDQNIPVHLFTGNHDTWIFDYLPKECGVILHTHNQIFNINGKRFLMGHGDALNPKDKGYLWLYRTLHNPFLQSCFRLLHPDMGIWLAKKWSSHSRLKHGEIKESSYLGDEKEESVQFCKQTLLSQHFDYFIFGHRHLQLDIKLSENSRYINTGDWISFYSYATFDGNDVALKNIKERFVSI